MRTFNVIVNNKKIGEVKARSYSDAFFEVDNKFGEKTAIDCKLEQQAIIGRGYILQRDKYITVPMNRLLFPD